MDKVIHITIPNYSCVIDTKEENLGVKVCKMDKMYDEITNGY
jgi:hypothetical protein